ncbi:MAG: SIR2 family protein [Rhizobiales bacterium]|nr:SIR2 family protein [Hyphomicrobiales bacterium]
MPAAWDITILETLALLDAPLREFAEGVAEDSYAVWLGAGISLGKLPGLQGVAEAVLEHVRSQIDHTNPDCAFKLCLDNMLALVVLNNVQRAEVDYAAPAASWPPIDEIRKQLVSRYGTMLDQAPATKPLDYLVWEGVQVVARYANPATTPGPEHLGLAALIMEGVASDSSSANWDDLIEKAVRILDGPTSSVLQVRVLPGDVQNNVRRARLYKFHGCAALAGHNEAVYRPRIVAREAQIHGWADKPENQVIAGKLLDLAISKATLMLGLSAQDTNIQEVFVKASTQLPASFPTHPPAVVVSENSVGTHQRSLLQNFYRNDYEGQTAQINAASLVKSYARSLLPSLWLHVLCAKLAALVDRATPALIPADRDRLRFGLVRLRNLAAGAADPNDHESFMLKALHVAGRALRLFTRGRLPAAGHGIYTSLSDKGLTQTLADPHLDTDGLVELSLALGLIGCGVQEGHWTCVANDTASMKAGAIALSGVTGQSEVFFAASAHAAAQIFAQGHVADDDDAIMIHSFEVPARAARHPTSAPGRTGKLSLREFSVSSVARNAISLDTLLKQFKAEMVL